MLAGEAMMFYAEPGVTRDFVADDVRPALAELAAAFAAVGEWRAEAIMSAIRVVIDKHKLKLPKLAMPLRMIVFGRAQTPNLGPVLALAGRKRVLERLQAQLSA
jgi:glutamyl-tRNA synthetase